MIFEVSVGNEPLPTYRALVRFLSVMDSEMCFQIASLSETFVAVFICTDVRFLSSLESFH